MAGNFFFVPNIKRNDYFLYVTIYVKYIWYFHNDGYGYAIILYRHLYCIHIKMLNALIKLILYTHI